MISLLLPHTHSLYCLVDKSQEGRSISRQNLNENLETIHLAPMLFYHLPGFYLNT